MQIPEQIGLAGAPRLAWLIAADNVHGEAAGAPRLCSSCRDLHLMSSRAMNHRARSTTISTHTCILSMRHLVNLQICESVREISMGSEERPLLVRTSKACAVRVRPFIDLTERWEHDRRGQPGLPPSDATPAKLVHPCPPVARRDEQVEKNSGRPQVAALARGGSVGSLQKGANADLPV